MNTQLDIIILLSVILGLLHLFVSAHLTTKVRGLKWNLSSREGTPPPLSGIAGRVDRAFQNYKETYPFFLAAVFLAIVTGKVGYVSQVSAWIYLIARILYFPVYAFNIIMVRTALWGLSLLGIVGLLTAVFI